MIKFNFSEECYSCSACINVCPQSAIKMNNDLIPVVNKKLCINCKKCDNVCIKINEKDFKPFLSSHAVGWACKNIDINQRKNSSSGGVFILLAENVLNNNGYVCGVIYDEYFMPKHIVTKDRLIVEKMMGSKYVVSDMSTCIKEMKEILDNGFSILFSGVPCQVAAVKTVLGQYDKLYLISVVCHGIIERKFWKSFLEKERQRGSISCVSMRDKSKGWLNYGLKMQFSDGSVHLTFRNNDGYFLQCFTDGLFERERCLSCKYKGTNILADILLGDGWGVESKYPDMVDSDGVSEAICLTDIGNKLFSDIKRSMDCRRIDVEYLIERNKRIISPAPDNKQRIKFQKYYMMYPEKINEICEKFGRGTIFTRIKGFLYSKFRKMINI